MSANSQRLALLDGHGIIFRAYFGAQRNPLSSSKTGEVTSAVYGFANTLLRVIRELKPTHIAVTLDRPGPTFRHTKDEKYKAHRPPMPDDLRPQVHRVRELIEAFNIPIFECDGFEADDCLGTLSRQAAERGVETYVVTLDSDILQLVRPGVKVFMFLLQKFGNGGKDTLVYDSDEKVFDRYKVLPRQIPDFKGLKGDTSDNIPGVQGIGEVTAAKLLQQFSSVDGIYQHLDDVKPARIQQLLRDGEEIARHSVEMATIVDNAPIELDLAKCVVHDYDRDKVLHLFNELEFRSLVNRLAEVEATFKPERRPVVEKALAEEAATYTTVTELEALSEVVEQIRAAGSVTLDTETTSQSAMLAKLVGISLAVQSYEAYYIPVGHAPMIGDPEQLPLDVVLERLRPVLEDPAIAVTGHNIKYDAMVLANHGIRLGSYDFDTMIAAYLTASGSTSGAGLTHLGLKSLALDRLGVEMTNIDELIGKGKKAITMAEAPIERAAAYAAADADMTLRLRGIFEGELHEKELWRLFKDIEMPLVPVLLQMERTGMALDTDVLRGLSQECAEAMGRLEAEFYEAVGETVNINSPQQLSKVFFEKLDLPKTRKTALGWSTDAVAMESLRDTHPAVNLLFEYREVAKLKSTYLDALPGMVNPHTGRVHTTLNQTRAATGRLSSEDPNLQNIPTRTALGRRVRRAFVARPDGSGPAAPGWSLVSADYSQIELRILAHLSREPFLIEAFQQDEDIHRATAAQLYNVPLEAVTPAQRGNAKTVNFAVLYGSSAQGLSQRTEMSRSESMEFIRRYFERYPLVKRYLDDTVTSTRRLGYAATLSGRRRYISDITSGNFNLRQAAERQAINHPIQGTSADLIKLAMIRILQALIDRRLAARMVLQIHDELLFECPDAEVPAVAALACELMPAGMSLDVPLKVEVKTGPNWGEMQPLHL